MAALVGVAGGLGCEGRKTSLPPPPSSTTAASVGVRVQVVQPTFATLPGGDVWTGNTFASRTTRVMAEAAGRVVETRVDDGQRVKAGDVLLRLDSSRQRLALDNANVAVRARQVDADWADKDAVRKRDLRDKNVISQLELDAAQTQQQRAQVGLEQAQVAVKNAKRALADTVVRAAHDGVVHNLRFRLGDTVAPGVPLMELVLLHPLKVRLALGPSHLKTLRPGTSALVFVDDDDGPALPAEVAWVAPQADLRTGLFDVELHANNPAPTQPGQRQQVRAGMVAQVSLVDVKRQPHLLLPSRLVVRRGGRDGVFVVDNGTAKTAKARFQQLQLGQRAQDLVEVKDGLDRDALVVATSLNAIADGSALLLDGPPQPSVTASTATSRETAP